MVELLRDVLSKGVTSSSWRDAPATSVIWVRPEKITDWSLVRSLLHSIELSDLIEGINTWGESTMEAEDLVLDDSCEWEVIKELCELFPYVSVTVLSQAFIIEAINLCDLSALVVTSKDSESIFKADLEGNEESDSLNRVVTTINVVTHEEIVGVGRLTTNLK